MSLANAAYYILSSGYLPCRDSHRLEHAKGAESPAIKNCLNLAYPAPKHLATEFFSV